MGFSVSGATALLFVAALVGFSMMYTAAANGAERVNEAERVDDERLLEQRNADITVANVSYDAASDVLTVRVNNTGSATLTVAETDLLADNDYLENASTTVAGSTTTDVWVPGEQLTFTANLVDRPDRVKVITGPGVAETEVV